jgi:hypothetical protein
MRIITYISISLLAVLFAAGAIHAQVQLPDLDMSQNADTVAVADSTDSLAQPSAPELAQPARGPKKLKIVRRAYKYRRQLGLALGMMAFVALIFTTTQNWNPK